MVAVCSFVSATLGAFSEESDTGRSSGDSEEGLIVDVVGRFSERQSFMETFWSWELKSSWDNVTGMARIGDDEGVTTPCSRRRRLSSSVKVN